MSRAGTSPMERRITPLPPILPMLARGGGKPFDDTHFGFEVKWDGMRALILVDTTFRLQSRHLTTITPQFPELDFRSLPPGTAIDGEIVVFKEELPSFRALQVRAHLQAAPKIALASAATPATFMAFDLLYDRGDRLTDRPLAERRTRLAELLDDLPQERLLLSDQIIGKGSAYFNAIVQKGIEGVIAKRLDSPYLPGKRSPSWVKIVNWQIKPLRVLGYVKERGADRVKALAVGRRQGRRWQYLGTVGAASEDKGLLYRELKDEQRLAAPPVGPTAVEWRNVKLRCYVRFFEDVPAGRLRQATFKGWIE